MEKDTQIGALAEENFINLLSYRKNGAGIQTPVWFVEEQRKLYIRTMAASGKVKRVKRDPRVRIAPCDAMGKLKGSWMDGKAAIVSDDSLISSINTLLNHKYGIMKRLLDVRNVLSKTPITTLVIELVDA